MTNRLLWIALAVLGGGLILLIINDSSGETFGLANEDFGRLLYLGVLGAIIAAHQRRHLWQAEQITKM